MGKRKQVAAVGQQPQQQESSSTAEKPIVLLPGDDVSDHIVDRASLSKNEIVSLGNGLRRGDDDDRVYATLSGALQYVCRSGGGNKKKRHVYWIRSSNSARLQVQDRVVGTVLERVGPDGEGGDFYRIHLGKHCENSATAILSNLSFEGATKRNKPNLELGQVLYARVSEWVNGLEPQLSCQLGPHDSSAIKAKDWMTNEGVYGVLKGGTVLEVSSGLARVLLSPQGVALWDSVCQHDLTSKFEIAIGTNGMIWLHASPSPQATLVLQNAILNSTLLTPAQTAGMVQQLVFTMRKQMKQKEDSSNAGS